MGFEVTANCRDCGKSFSVSHGGGFNFHLLNCDRCGKEKSLTFDRIRDLHTAFLKFAGIPYSAATREKDAKLVADYSGRGISEAEYHAGVEEAAGHCRCGGHFRLAAPTRCPNCHSANVEEQDEPTLFYD